jgi:hypothetical protein
MCSASTPIVDGSHVSRQLVQVPTFADSRIRNDPDVTTQRARRVRLPCRRIPAGQDPSLRPPRPDVRLHPMPRAAHDRPVLPHRLRTVTPLEPRQQRPQAHHGLRRRDGIARSGSSTTHQSAESRSIRINASSASSRAAGRDSNPFDPPPPHPARRHRVLQLREQRRHPRRVVPRPTGARDQVGRVVLAVDVDPGELVDHVVHVDVLGPVDLTCRGHAPRPQSCRRGWRARHGRSRRCCVNGSRGSCPTG